MDVEGFCRQSNVIIVVGKGGVGKTTLSAALSLMAAREGLRVVLGALDDSEGLPKLFGFSGAFGYDEVDFTPSSSSPDQPAHFPDLPGSVHARVLTSDGALLEYLESHGLGRVSKRLVQTGALDVVATAIPGVRDVLVLGKLKQLERDEVADLIVLDAPASGHAVSFLTSSSGLFDAARGGPLRAQAEQVMELLADPQRCQVLLVTIPEETPINEAIETAYRLEEEVGVFLGPIVINGCYPELSQLEVDPSTAGALLEIAIDPALTDELRRAARFRLARQRLQRQQLARLANELALEQIELPYLFDADFGPLELGAIAESLRDAIAAL